MKLELIKPEIFSRDNGVESFFTLANRDRIKQNKATVKGLHLGAFSHGEDPSVEQNYSTLFNAIGWDQDQLAIAKQVHGSNVRTVTKPNVYHDCDGLVTNQKGLAIGIQVADCAAILLHEPEAGVIAAVHAGWRGAIAGIISEGVKAMQNLEGEPSKIFAYISPCISLQNFEVGSEVANLFPKQFCDDTNFDKPHIDLRGFLKYQLMNEGISADHIETSESCTFADKQFFSYRRDKENAGRMLSLIKLRM